MSVWNHFTLSNLLSLVFVGYVAVVVRNLVDVATVPLSDASSAYPLSSSVPSEFSLLLFLSNSSTLALNVARREAFYLGGFLGATYDDAVPRSTTEGDGVMDIEDLRLPAELRANATIYLHSFLVKEGDKKESMKRSAEISMFMRPENKDEVPRYNLLTGEDEGSARVIYSSLPPRIEVGVILETRSVDGMALAQKGFAGLVDARKGRLRLPLYMNTHGSPRDEYKSVNGSLSLRVDYRAVSLSYYLLAETLVKGFNDAEQVMKVNSYDLDSFRMMVTGSGPWKLVLVYTVSILHLIFEYLALKSDFAFWKDRTSFEGLSASSIKMTVVSFLYVLELGESQLVLYFLAARMLFNAWKLARVAGLELRASFPFVARVPAEASAQGEELAEAEVACMRWLGLLLAPVVAAFCGYRLIYYHYRSWYSWLVLSLAAASEVLGFVTMTPQVFLNYRLKSVEHLPWRALSYQAVNTFIDDVFTLVIRVPEIHKFSVLRDDIVFIVCLIQRWLYRGRRGQDSPPEPAAEGAKPEAPAAEGAASKELQERAEEQSWEKVDPASGQAARRRK